MNKSNVNTILWVATITLLLTTIAFAIAYFVTASNKDEYKNQLEYVYEKSFYELIDNVNNIEMNLSKLSSSNSKSYQLDIIDKLIEQSNLAQDNLATLPLNDKTIEKTVSFINQTNGYCTSLANQLGKGEALSDDQKYSVEQLHDSSVVVKKEVNRFATLLTDDYSIVENMKTANDTFDSNFSRQFSNLEQPSVEYPQLIYDGPFSESVLNKEIKGLPKESVTRIQAQEKVIKDLFDYKKIEYSGMTNGKFITYNFELDFTDNSKGFVQVTKDGGFILSFNRTHDLKQAKYSQEECVDLATKFVEELGLKNMKSVWYEDAQGYLYVNLAYMLDDIVVYPDLIKIKVAMDTGEVMGMEAMTYAYNHIERKISKPVTTKTDAENAVTPELAVQKITLCIIPNEYVGETLAWEVQATRDGDQYYAYIDADSGLLIKIMKVIETEDGNLLM